MTHPETDQEMHERLIQCTDARLASRAIMGSKRYYAALPYLQYIEEFQEGLPFQAESLREAWLYALSNLSTWRGQEARTIKKIIKSRYGFK